MQMKCLAVPDMKQNRSREPETPAGALMDYGDMIIHIFDEENRLFYDLERIWRDGKILDAEEFLGENE